MLSNSPDDIPATGDDIVTYLGSTAKARANHNIAFVQINNNDQRVWFSPDASPGMGRTYYNRRYRADGTSPWYWQYSVSPPVIQYELPISAGPSAVLYSSTAKYRDSASNTFYNYLMYQVLQTGNCDSPPPGVTPVLGFLFVSFSSDGICWTAPRQAVRASGDGPSFGCLPSATNTVPIESASAADDGNAIYLAGVEGDVSQLIQPDKMDLTQTSIASASFLDPSTISLFTNASGQYQTVISSVGLFQPAFASGIWSNPRRYTTYAYFLNMQIGFDAANGDLYIGRGYPYGFDRGSLGSADTPTYNVTPSFAQVQEQRLSGPRGQSIVQGCADAPATFPNRLQVYKMHIGALSNLQQTTTGTWTLVTDFGGSVGYDVNTGPPAAIFSPMINVGRDLGAISFLRDASGNLVRSDSGRVELFGGDTFKLHKGSGACQITGLERETLFTLTVP